MDIELAKKKWKWHKRNAINKGVTSHLSFEDYCTKIKEASITVEQIGKRSGQYQLGRYTDEGDYTIESCRFITMYENHLDKVKNGGINSMIVKRTGRTKETCSGVASASAKKTGRTVETCIGVRNRSMKVKGRTKDTHDYIKHTANLLSEGHSNGNLNHVKIAIGLANGRSYCMIDPQGNLHEGKNLSKLCRDYGLCRVGMGEVKAGRRAHHKGWRLYVG